MVYDPAIIKKACKKWRAGLDWPAHSFVSPLYCNLLVAGRQ
jgi:hypothetical protein